MKGNCVFALAQTGNGEVTNRIERRTATPGEPGLTHSFLVFNEAESCFALLGAQLREFLHEIRLFAATKSLAWTDFSASRTHPSLSPAVRICSADRWDGCKTSGQSVSGAL
jgi:hypothetical protein